MYVKLIGACVVSPYRTLKHGGEHYIKLVAMLSQYAASLFCLVDAHIRKLNILPPGKLILFIKLRFTVPQKHNFVASHVPRPHFYVYWTHHNNG